MKKEDEDDEDTMKQSVLFMGERGHGTRLVRACVRHAPALRPHMKYNRDFSSNYTGGSLSLSLFHVCFFLFLFSRSLGIAKQAR